MKSWTPLVALVSSHFGDPKVRHPEETRAGHGERGKYHRRCWVWFPNNVNHHFKIDRYPDSSQWETAAGNHGGVDVSLWTRAEPNADQIRAVLVLAGLIPGADMDAALATLSSGSMGKSYEFRHGSESAS